MLRFAALLVVLSMIASLACSSDDDGGKPSVVAITTQIGDFTANVAGDRVSLTVLLKPNQDAHDFEPSPSQLRRLSDADLVLRHGLGLDAYVDKAVENTSGTVVTVTDGARTVPAPPGEEADEFGGIDPHAWFSVANARVMVTNIRNALTKLDPANASYYADNATRYLQTLDQLDSRIRSAVTGVPQSCRKLVTNHDFLGHYADAYGFTIVGAVIPSTSTQASASASQVADIVRKIKAEGVPAIFAETSVNPDLINQVGREAGVTVVDDLYSDSLGPKKSDGATYVEMMDANTKKIVDALKSCRT
jgi:ABC-type Zn uptake system ZnuABC Zn-binding protein ZnuA